MDGNQHFGPHPKDKATTTPYLTDTHTAAVEQTGMLGLNFPRMQTKGYTFIQTHESFSASADDAVLNARGSQRGL